jgi:hypothetical protein
MNRHCITQRDLMAGAFVLFDGVWVLFNVTAEAYDNFSVMKNQGVFESGSSLYF